MESTNGINRKKLILIALAGIVLVIAIIAAIVGLSSHKSNAPTKSTVQPGQTITQQQIEQGAVDNNGTQAGSGTATSTPSTTPPPAPTTTDFYNLITNANTAPSSFGIIKTQNPLVGWYVVTIKSGNLEPAQVIFKQTNDPNNPLTIVAGPGTYFPPDTISLPDAVRKVVGS